jgi:hypothetical protein
MTLWFPQRSHRYRYRHQHLIPDRRRRRWRSQRVKRPTGTQALDERALKRALLITAFLLSANCGSFANNVSVAFNENVDDKLGSLSFFDANLCAAADSYLCNVVEFYCEKDNEIRMVFNANRGERHTILTKIGSNILTVSSGSTRVSQQIDSSNVFRQLNVQLDSSAGEDRVDRRLWKLSVPIQKTNLDQVFRAVIQYGSMRISYFGHVIALGLHTNNEENKRAIERWLSTS